MFYIHFTTFICQNVYKLEGRKACILHIQSNWHGVSPSPTHTHDCIGRAGETTLQSTMSRERFCELSFTDAIAAEFSLVSWTSLEELSDAQHPKQHSTIITMPAITPSPIQTRSSSLRCRGSPLAVIGLHSSLTFAWLPTVVPFSAATCAANSASNSAANCGTICAAAVLFSGPS